MVARADGRTSVRRGGSARPRPRRQCRVGRDRCAGCGARQGPAAREVAATPASPYDGRDIIEETRSVEGQADQVYTYIHAPGIDEPLARVDGSGVAYFHADGLGSIVKMTDASAATLSDRVYDAWGNPELGAAEPGYAFTT